MMESLSDLDCGVATPEAYDDLSREALQVLNVNIIGDLNRERVLKFVCARVLHFKKHLPEGSSQRIRFDLRGQKVSNSRLDQIRRAIIEESRRHAIQVTVEYLTN